MKIWHEKQKVFVCIFGSGQIPNSAVDFVFAAFRMENLDLMVKYGSQAWKVHNQHLEAFLARSLFSIIIRCY